MHTPAMEALPLTAALGFQVTPHPPPSCPLHVPLVQSEHAASANTVPLVHIFPQNHVGAQVNICITANPVCELHVSCANKLVHPPLHKACKELAMQHSTATYVSWRLGRGRAFAAMPGPAFKLAAAAPCLVPCLSPLLLSGTARLAELPLLLQLHYAIQAFDLGSQ